MRERTQTDPYQSGVKAGLEGRTENPWKHLHLHLGRDHSREVIAWERGRAAGAAERARREREGG